MQNIHTSPVGQSKTLLNVFRFDPDMRRVDHWLERKSTGKRIGDVTSEHDVTEQRWSDIKAGR